MNVTRFGSWLQSARQPDQFSDGVAAGIHFDPFFAFSANH
jgi:hypothetical protein